MKQCILVCSLLINQMAVAQYISNGHFEDWTNDSIMCPTGYDCSSLYQAGYSDFQTVTKEPRVNGGHGIILTTHQFGSDTVCGYVMLGDVGTLKGGMAFSSRPDSMAIELKYDIVPGDTALIMVLFLRSGTLIGSARRMITGQMPVYRQSTIPVNWQLQGQQPDSLIFVAASSNILSKKGFAETSTLAFDNVRFYGRHALLPNYSFESWDYEIKSTPADWSSPIDEPEVFRLNVLEQLTGNEAYDGISARLRNVIKGTDTIKGTLTSSPMAFPFEVDTLLGYYRFSAPNVDSAIVHLEFWDAQNSFHRYFKLPEVSRFTQFRLPFNLPSTPDSVQISFLAGDQNNSEIQHNAILDIDSLWFSRCFIPQKPFGLSVPDSICEDDSLITVFSLGDTRFQTFDYSFPEGFINSSTSQGSASLEVEVVSGAAKSGFITVVANTACGTSPLDSVYIFVDTIPATPNITYELELSGSPGMPGFIKQTLDAGVNALCYTWSYNGDPLPDSTRQFIRAFMEQGYYSVLPKNSVCVGQKATYHFYSPNAEDVINSSYQKSKLYPNPASNSVTFTTYRNGTPSLIKVYNTNGQEVLRVANQTVLNVSKLHSGLYTVVATDHHEVYVHTLVVE